MDLSAILVSRLEAWLTRHVSVETIPGQPASPRLSLSGSDKSAFSDVLLEFSGSWESTIQYAGSLYRWKDTQVKVPKDQWARVANSWPFLRHHLHNSAYFLALAVWNEDEIGAERFLDSLVRWPEVFEFQLADPYYSAYERLLFPNLFSLDWSVAKTKVNMIEGLDFERGVEPLALAATIIRPVHDDAVVLTSAVLLNWAVAEKQATDISARFASRLLADIESSDDSSGRREMAFVALFFEILRIDLAGDLFPDEGYGKELDRLVSLLDGMTERRVVPGRVFTPSTAHGRDDLLVSFAIMLILKIPKEGSENIVSRISDMIGVEGRLPQGDRSLFQLVQFIERLLTTLSDYSRLQDLLARVSLNSSYRSRIESLTRVLVASIDLIKTHRTEKIRNLPVDLDALEIIRAVGEQAILEGSFVGIFQGFVVEKVDAYLEADTSEWLVVKGLPRGMFTKPRMEYARSELDGSIVESIKSLAGRSIWRAFFRRPRMGLAVEALPDDPSFWKEMSSFKEQVGAAPVLLLPENYRENVFDWAFHPANRPTSLAVERKSKADHQGGGYIATIEGLDVFSGGANGNPVLLSSRALRSVRYGFVDDKKILQLIPVNEDDPWKMTLRAKLAQLIEWDDAPILEIKISARNGAEP